MLNKFEKEQLVIKLLTEGRTTREIAKEVHISFRQIGEITRKLKGETKENSSPAKSIETQALALFAKGKSQTDVAILLDTSTKKVTTIYKEFLRLRRMQELVGLYDLISKNRNGIQAFCLIRHSGDMSQPSSRQAFYL
jgi:hypothetical protein